MTTFTFKADKPTGSYRSFYKTFHNIKLKKKIVGQIIEESPFTIRLMVHKEYLMEDGNPNCDWKWIHLKKKSESIEEAKQFLKDNCDKIIEKFNLRQQED